MGHRLVRSLKKRWLNQDNDIYLIKGYHKARENRTPVVMEYYASQLAEAMKISCVQYALERYIHPGGESEVVCKCPLFTSEKIGFVSALSVLEHERVDWHDWQLETEALHMKFARIFGETFYADMMLFDAIILNRDRHLSNFGMLIDNNTGGYIGAAPLFDNGNSLLFYEDNLDRIGPAPNGIWPYCGAYLLFDTAAYLFLEERHIPILQKLSKFEFQQPDDNTLGVSNEILGKMNRIVQARSKALIKLYKQIFKRWWAFWI